ncbi:MAG TPA: protein phosphatase 2C domain-containing protein [Pyrinomonadaceae bacterium]|jgi:protein phosphatase
MLVELYAKTDIGRIRAGNEDNFLVLDLTTEKAWLGTEREASHDELHRFELGERGLVLVVSDGMGGALAGDVASLMAVEIVRDMLIGNDVEEGTCGPDTPLVDCLRNATDYANYAIHRRSQEDARCAGMGATLTGAAITGTTLDFVQVGDSRAYVMRGEEIKLTTKDQSLVQQLVDVGQISEQEAETHMFRNVILQALGAQAELAPVTGRVHIHQGDILLLCSDGLSGKLRAEDMHRLIGQSRGDLAAACDALIEEANARGGEDNITVIIARFTGDELPKPGAPRITVEHLSHDGDARTLIKEEDTTENP